MYTRRAYTLYASQESVSLATNVKHTSKLLIELTQVKALDAAKRQAYLEKSDLTPLETVHGNISCCISIYIYIYVYIYTYM